MKERGEPCGAPASLGIQGRTPWRWKRWHSFRAWGCRRRSTAWYGCRRRRVPLRALRPGGPERGPCPAAAHAAASREDAPRIAVQDAVASAIWGEGRFDPGDAAWTMRHARTLGVSLRARIAVLGAGVACSLRDLKAGTRWRLAGYSRTPEQAKGQRIYPYETAMSRVSRGAAGGSALSAISTTARVCPCPSSARTRRRWRSRR